ncbi:MAG TPA: tetratricopeptide repeat protein [Rhodanobacteraceae bacterium]
MTQAFASRRWTPAILFALLVVLLAVTWWAYHPGLNGGFLFDDFANLPTLGATGPVDNWATFWRYITSGRADPTGRPIALLSFLIDAHNWPASPRPFLVTSVILHLINGMLLFGLLRVLGCALSGGGPSAVVPFTGATLRWRANLAALLGSALWLLHPLMVSTTLYIVQREAMLAATFVLVGLLLWLHGRRRMLDGHRVSGCAWMVLGLGGGTLLAILSKANGVLLPALALTIEYTVLRHPCGQSAAQGLAAAGTTRAYRRALLVLGWLPACVVVVYLVHSGWAGFMYGTGSRPWSMGQRLLTEPRVLMDYWQLLWIPRPFTPGLFNDQIHASLSLVAPWTTLPCMLVVAGLIVAALLLRKRWPAWALAVLFYFVGQALESSSVALELYFEHRNYLPAMLMFWALALWLCGVRQTALSAVATDEQGHVPRPIGARRMWGAPGNWAWAKAVLAVLLLLGLAAMTHARTSVWGNTREQAKLWATLNPDSPRAQANAAQAELHAGKPRLAAAHLRALLKRDPSQVQLAFNLFAAECDMGHVSAATLQATKRSLQLTSNPGALLEHWFGRAIVQAAHPPCPQLSLDTIGQLLAAAQSNHRLMAIGGRRQDLLYLQGQMALVRHQPQQALADFEKALDQNVRIGFALAQAAAFGAQGYPRLGLAMLAYYETRASRHAARPGFGMPMVHAWVLHREHYWQDQLVYLRKTLRADAAAKAAAARL